ncbi:atp-dependent transcriptional regulator [Leptolyngbya sp. Heron Island J]|uniref:AfsR/SARP family transcriptional regulator n=1 Tax=Leptolyngbya sp. Heron Island J TaxID=1385935 RepID=UPI0003B9F436|nr:BTAD domain-containing putative transcriptional regulator [Leptolyngbya sp. Heron Island J]ESA34047.1 atp-dependent transcriptional regulator [Leptolyngbya sp. Heron Island J]
MSLWTVQLLGQFQLKDPAGITQPFRTQKTAKLLAFLVFFHEKSHSREQLADMLWPESPPERARNSLRVSLYSLRQQLSLQKNEVLFCNSDTVQINSQYFTVDTWQIEALLSQAKNCTKAHQRLSYLEKIVQRDYGLFLQQYDDHWITSERYYWQTIYLDTLHQLVDEFLEIGQYTVAAAYAQMAIKADPYAEQAHVDLMRAHVAMGRPVAARQQYLELKRLFQKELNLPLSDFVYDIAKKLGLCNGILTFL